MNKYTKKISSLETFLSERYDFRYNEVALRVEMRKKGTQEFSQVWELNLWREVNEEDLGYTYGVDYICNLLGATTFSRPYNPIKCFFENAKINPKRLPFNLEEYNPFEQLTSFVDLADRGAGHGDYQKLFCDALTRWFVSAIKCVYEPRYAAKQCLVLMGPQSIGKTPFVRFLLPDALQWLIKTNPNLSPMSKDSRIALASNLVIEIDEVDDWLKAKSNRDGYKEYMTTTFVNERLPYARASSSLQRISSFIGTCNESRFLSDPTSTDRWIVFELRGFKNRQSGVSFPIEEFPIEACWAFAYERYKEGFDPSYNLEEMRENDQENERFKYNSFEFEVLQDYLEPSNIKEEAAEFLKSSDIAAFLNDEQEKVVFTAAQLGRALTRSNFKRVYHERRYGYWVKKIRK